jgi:4-amino-4-deoxy-L-arabinose transferase-like glycosyltransferase
MLLILLFLLVVHCVVSMEQNHREEKRNDAWFMAMAALAGALTGICGLTRYSCAGLVLPVAVFLMLYLGRRRWVLGPVALVACVLVMAPWVIRNYSVSGTCSAQRIRTVSGYRTFPRQPAGALSQQGL